MNLLLLLASLALAEDPSAVVEGTVVRGTALIAVSPARFLAQLEDPAWESRISGSGTRVEVKGRAGDCLDVAFVSPNAILEARYELRRCPQPDGVRSTLLTSNAFSAYTSRWRASTEGAGARVTYEVDLTTSLWVPNSLVRSETRRAVLKLMRAIAAWSEAQGG